jgi:hypothetical protein
MAAARRDLSGLVGRMGMRRTTRSCPVDPADDARPAIVAPRAPLRGRRGMESSMSDRDRVMAGLDSLVEGGLARWSTTASPTRTLILISGERFAVTKAGIVRT